MKFAVWNLILEIAKDTSKCFISIQKPKAVKPLSMVDVVVSNC